MHDQINKSLQYIQSKTKYRPQIGIILGSGLGDFVKKLQGPEFLSYSEIPHFAPTTVEGHEGKLCFGTINSVEVVMMQGRVHLYEGHDIQQVVHPIRVLGKMGVKTLVITNAAGGVNLNLLPGDLAFITDHLNLTGKNPLIGHNDQTLGERFPDMSEAYSKKAIGRLQQAAKSKKIPIKEGVYCGLLGPSYETPAEIRMLRTMGTDMVGMSTVSEVIAANHMGIEVLGISCITNCAAGIRPEKLSHEEVKEVAHFVREKFTDLLTEYISLTKVPNEK